MWVPWAVLRLVSWSVAYRRAAWAEFDGLGADVALVQEAGAPGPEWALEVVPDAAGGWETALPGGRPGWRTAVVRLTDRVRVRPRATVTLEAVASYDDWIVSRAGSIAAADVVTGGEIAFTAVSVYAGWDKVGARGRGYADGSAHRILSDLSALMVRPDHRLVVAGDWNLLRGYGEQGDEYWKARYDTVFERAGALGLRFVGPNTPTGVRRTRGRANFRPTAAACRPFTTRDRTRPPPPASSISCLPRFPSRTASRYARSTRRKRGAPAITAES